eukprot:GHVU01068674.1.p1 GENE.GHVU01068674.1~~GHVU01068674.1.p1  ORF type:complete len:342 (+),score=12.18 GHVU01068674.1:702-1727(+)
MVSIISSTMAATAQIRMQYYHPLDPGIRPVAVIDTELTFAEFLQMASSRFGSSNLSLGNPVLGSAEDTTPAFLRGCTQAVIDSYRATATLPDDVGEIDLEKREGFLPQQDIVAMTGPPESDRRAPVTPHACVHENRRLPFHPLPEGVFKPTSVPPALGGPDTPANHSTCPMNDVTYPAIRLLGAPEAHPLGQDFLWSRTQLWRPLYRDGNYRGPPLCNEIYGSQAELHDDHLLAVLPRVVFLQPMTRDGEKARPLTPFPVELVVGGPDEQHPWLDLERHSEYNWNGLPRFAVLPCRSDVSERLRDRRIVTDATRRALNLESREDEQLWDRLGWEEKHHMKR